MARVLLIVSILIGLVSAFLGFKTKQQAEQLKNTLSSTKTTLQSTQGKLTKVEGELKETSAKLQSTEADLKKAEEEATNAKGQLATAQSDLKKAQDEVSEKAKQVADIEAKIVEIQTNLKGIEGINLQTLPQYLQDLSSQKTKLETELAEAKQVQETLKARADELQTTADTKERVIQEYKQNVVRVGLTGKIVAYNPGWNFVVLNIGDKQGLKTGVQMVVLRDGGMVGKVRVTSVEPSTAVADVLPGSVARGDSVQPGDSVVFEGRR